MADVLFDFPCSDTFRRAEDALLGRESYPRDDDAYDKLQREVDIEMYLLDCKHHNNVLGARQEVKESIHKGARTVKKPEVKGF